MEQIQPVAYNVETLVKKGGAVEQWSDQGSDECQYEEESYGSTQGPGEKHSKFCFIFRNSE